MVLRTAVRARPWWVVTAALLLAACSGGDVVGTSTEPGPGPVTQEASGPGASGCEQRGEPCTLGEAPPEALAATGILTEVAADYLGAGVEPSVVADAFAGIPAVVETGWDELGVFFRVEDAPPAWVMLEEIDGRAVEGGWVSAAPVALDAPGLGRGVAAVRAGGSVALATVPGGGGGSVAGTPGEGKRALVVSPYAFGMTAELVPLLAADRDFSQRGGRVEARVRDTPVEPRAAIAAFEGWDAFDTIVLGTHGVGVCELGPDGKLLEDESGGYVGCRTVLSAGPVLGTLEEVTAEVGDVPGVVVAQSAYRMRTDLSNDELHRRLVEVCIPALEAYPSPEAMDPCEEPFPEDEPRNVKIGLTADFFAATYPGGLPDRIVALFGCHSMRFDDVASRLVGGHGAVIGYPTVVWSDQSAEERGRLVQALLRGQPLADALAANADRHPAGVIGGPRLRHIGNETIRARDVVALMDGTDELQDGAFVTLTTTPEGELAAEMTVRVSRVGEDEAISGFRPEIWVDGELAAREVSMVDQGDGEWLSAPVAVPLPEGFEPGDRFTAEVRSALPSGGESRWRYEDLQTQLTLRYRSHVTYEFPTHRGEGIMVAEGPLERGPDGWQASLPMWWESVEVTGLPPQCAVGEAIAFTTFEVLSGGTDGDGATLRWGVGVEGDEIQDRITITCSGVGDIDLGGIISQGLGAALGVAGMMVIHGTDASPDGWLADGFVPSDEPGVQLVHRQDGTFEEISAVVTIELLSAGR